MRVDFYILDAAEPASRFHFACRLTEKAYGLNNRVYAHAESAAAARKLDEMLWTFRQGSFIPHQLLTETNDRRAPVSVGTGSDCETEGDLLINLDSESPSFAKGFDRVAEIICGDDESRQAGRARFKYYRDLGIEPQTHQISR
jgi:DNA polymerase-3 subunit chi